MRIKQRRCLCDSTLQRELSSPAPSSVLRKTCFSSKGASSDLSRLLEAGKGFGGKVEIRRELLLRPPLGGLPGLAQEPMPPPRGVGRGQRDRWRHCLRH